MEPEQSDVVTSRSVDEDDDELRAVEPTETPSITQATCGCAGERAVAEVQPEAQADPVEDAANPSYVYALGRIEARFPSPGIEKEFAQVLGRAEAPDLTDEEMLHRVLSDPDNRYLVRQLCFVLSVQGIETYILRPRDPVDLNALVDAVRPVSSPMDLDVVIGVRGPVAPPELCNGLTIPVVTFDKIYSFDSEELIKAVERPKDIPAKDFEKAAKKVLERFLQIGDNAGAADEHRVLNYLAVRYEKVYQETVKAYADGFRLSGVDVYPSRLSGTRKILDVVFSFTSRKSDATEKSFVRVDATEQFLFIRTNWSPYYYR
ncbi:hypothetical protein ACQUSR_29485 [Streptomyces sp. P1-3]|uniref:cyanobactin maturation protease PatG family protein n=1 Tax=Streptomyces sp. P1-3 TaxID=3421658 RepID=UPI003D35AEF7